MWWKSLKKSVERVKKGLRGRVEQINSTNGNEQVACDDEQAETNAPHASFSEVDTKLGGDRSKVKLAIFASDNVDDSEQHGNLGVAAFVPSVARHDVGRK